MEKGLNLSLPNTKVLRWSVNAFVLACSLAVVLLILEWFVRVTGIQPMNPSPHLHQRSSVSGLVYELLPNLRSVPGFGRETVTTNALGLRSSDIDPAKPSIVFLGDSMTFGYGVEDRETNPAVAGERFPKYNVINAGVSSYNIEQEVLTYDHKLALLNPKLVVLEFVINDGEGKTDLSPEAGKPTEEQQRIIDERIRTAITQPGLINFPGKFFLHKHSALFRFLDRSTKWLPFRKHGQLLSHEWPEEQFAYYEQWLTRLSRTVGDRGKLFVLWPDGSVYPQTKQRLQEMASGLGWFVLDLSDLYGTHYKTLIWDHRPRASEQRRVGELIADVILKYGLLPKED